MKKKRLKAYTVIEIVMAIVIMAILAVLAIPRFDSFYSIKLNGAAKKLVSDIRYAQQLAISEHRDTRIVFNTTSETYTAQKYTTSWVAIIDPFSRGNLTQNFTTDLQYSGVDISSPTFSSSTLCFTWQGVPRQGSCASGTDLTVERSVTLNYRGNSITIFVTPQTGRVRAE